MKIEAIHLGPEVFELLDTEGFPTSDLGSSSSLNLLGVRKGERLIGVVGLEVYGQDGLVRSLVVAPDRRGGGVGVKLVHEAEIHALSKGVSTLYLLTMTAASFFSRIGYVSIERVAAPKFISATAEFQSLCPASALLMRKVLSPDGNAVNIDKERASQSIP